MNMEDIESGSIEYFPHGFLGKKEMLVHLLCQVINIIFGAQKKYINKSRN